MAHLNVRMSEEEYNKIKEDAVKFGFGTLEKPGISDYIRFLTKTVTISVTIAPPIIVPKTKINLDETLEKYRKMLRNANTLLENEEELKKMITTFEDGKKVG